MSKDGDWDVSVPPEVAAMPGDAAVTFLIFERIWTDDDSQVRTGMGVWTSPEVTNAPMEQQITLAERALNALSVKLDALKGEQARQAGEAH